jgi:hypothetical protein
MTTSLMFILLIAFPWSLQGFIMMTPQLFINYKLKSVAHLPWRAMVYKALNTFIDDLFAFVIKMPTMHRLACFRDDLIFFVYLYQRWIYRVDATRVNEFGQGGTEEADEALAAGSAGIEQKGDPQLTDGAAGGGGDGEEDGDAGTAPKSTRGKHAKAD